MTFVRCSTCQAVTDAGKPTRCTECPSWNPADGPPPYVCDWNPKPHRFCGGPNRRAAFDDQEAER